MLRLTEGEREKRESVAAQKARSSKRTLHYGSAVTSLLRPREEERRDLTQGTVPTTTTTTTPPSPTRRGFLTHTHTQVVVAGDGLCVVAVDCRRFGLSVFFQREYLHPPGSIVVFEESGSPR